MTARRTRQGAHDTRTRIRPIPFRPSVVKPAQFLGLAPVFWVNVLLAIVSIGVIYSFADRIKPEKPEQYFAYGQKNTEWNSLIGQIDTRVRESKKSDVDVDKITDDIILNEVPNACKRISRSMVFIEPVFYQIENSKRIANIYSRPYSGFFFMPSSKTSNEGYIITTFDAVDGADYALVTVSDDQITRAKVVGSDTDSNIGILKIDMALIDNPEKFKAVDVCTHVTLGEPIITAGATHRWKSSFFRGIISNTSRSLEFTLQNGQTAGTHSVFYQVSAPVSKGIEGGPTINSKGEVIAVNMRWLSVGDLQRDFSITYEYVKNLNFSLPIGYALKVADDIVSQGFVSRSYLGLDFQIFETLGKTSNVVVSYVAPDSPADKAGVNPGDILISVGPSPVEARDNDDLAVVRRRLSELKAGSNVEIKVDRNGKQIAVKVVPESWEETGDFEFLCSVWGLSVKSLTAREAAKRGLKESKGFFISYVDQSGRAAEAGLNIGDIIVSIETEVPVDKQSLEQLYGKLSGDKDINSVFFKIIRSGFTRCFLVKNSLRIKTENGQ